MPERGEAPSSVCRQHWLTSLWWCGPVCTQAYCPEASPLHSIQPCHMPSVAFAQKSKKKGTDCNVRKFKHIKNKHKNRKSRSHLVLSKLANDGLVQKEANVFKQVVGSRGRRALVDLLLVLGFMRIDSFQYAQSPIMWKTFINREINNI